jgi:hypothetical protein
MAFRRNRPHGFPKTDFAALLLCCFAALLLCCFAALLLCCFAA